MLNLRHASSAVQKAADYTDMGFLGRRLGKQCPWAEESTEVDETTQGEGIEHTYLRAGQGEYLVSLTNTDLLLLWHFCFSGIQT